MLHNHLLLSYSKSYTIRYVVASKRLSSVLVAKCTLRDVVDCCSALL
jgi:hypothetical protein